MKDNRYTNVYLDRPDDDSGIFGPDSAVYCLPAALDGERYLICMLLQSASQKGDEPTAFKRVGLTKMTYLNLPGMKGASHIACGMKR